jgi:hypothetical protein
MSGKEDKPTAPELSKEARERLRLTQLKLLLLSRLRKQEPPLDNAQAKPKPLKE